MFNLIKKSSPRIRHFSILFSSVLGAQSSQAAGLEHAKSILETFKAELLDIVPYIAVIVLIGLGIAYLYGAIDKGLFVRWFVGMIIIASASTFTSMMLSGS